MRDAPRVILLINSARTFERGLIRGIARYSAYHGPWVFYRQTPFYRRSQESENILARLKNWKADGIIMRENRMMDDILSLGLPAVVSPYAREQIDATTIIADNDAIGKMGADHLLNKGFNNYAFCGFNDQYWSVTRGKSFEKEILNAGKHFFLYRSPTSLKDRLWENEPFYMAGWLKGLPKPIAVMTATDERGQQVIEAAKIAGLKIPEQVAVLGVDNDELIGELSNPALSSIDINPEKAGYEAAHILHQLMKGEKVKKSNKIIKPRFIVTRRSTDIVAVEDKVVSQALHFINLNAQHQYLSVEDVVKQTPVSRRMLEEKFRKYLNKSILKEIKRVRINKISRMLTDTNLTISEIAFDLGFRSIQNVSRYFKQETGYTPQEYRKSFGKI